MEKIQITYVLLLKIGFVFETTQTTGFNYSCSVTLKCPQTALDYGMNAPKREILARDNETDARDQGNGNPYD